MQIRHPTWIWNRDKPHVRVISISGGTVGQQYFYYASRCSLQKMDPNTGGAVNVLLIKWAIHFMFFLLLCPCRPRGICSLSLSVSLWISFPVTPGLILMLNYFSFANDMARLQSVRLNMYAGCKGRTGFMEMWIHRCHSHSLPHYWWRCAQHIQYVSECVWVCACVCVCVCLSTDVFVCVCTCVLGNPHSVGPHSVITSTNAEYAWLHS